MKMPYSCEGRAKYCDFVHECDLRQAADQCTMQSVVHTGIQ